MGSYSSLVLVANEGVRNFSDARLLEILTECEIVRSMKSLEDFDNLMPDVANLFNDDAARVANDNFFIPAGVACYKQIQILGNEIGMEMPGHSINLHGPGYFFPWDQATLRERVTQSPKFTRLKQSVENVFGGRFVFPTEFEDEDEKAALYRQSIDHQGNWAWFASESF